MNFIIHKRKIGNRLFRFIHGDLIPDHNNLFSGIIPGSIFDGHGLSDRGATIVQILPGENQTWQEGPFNYTTYMGFGKYSKLSKPIKPLPLLKIF